MTRRPLPSLLPLLIAAAPLAFAGRADAFDLTVEVLNARSGQGAVLGAVYADADGWLKDGRAAGVALAPAGAKAVLVFRNLPAGRYAVSLYHDENGNAKLDANPAGIPTERYGFSRDARGRMGPPSFADAAIEFGADAALTVNLR